MLKPKNGGKNQRTKIFTICSGTLSQSIGRGRISREGARDARESRERRDQIVPNLLPEKHDKAILACFFPLFLSRIACCARESTSA